MVPSPGLNSPPGWIRLLDGQIQFLRHHEKGSSGRKLPGISSGFTLTGSGDGNTVGPGAPVSGGVVGIIEKGDGDSSGIPKGIGNGTGFGTGSGSGDGGGRLPE